MAEGAPKDRAPLVVCGQVRTMAGGEGVDAEAVAIRDGRIAAVGGRDLIESFELGEARVLDAADRTVLPGFVDPHVHLEHYARGRNGSVDCRAPGCASVADVLDALADGARGAEPGEWVVGFGNLFFDYKLADGRVPTRAELDQATGANPTIVRCGGHSSVLNSAGLEAIGIDRFRGGPGVMGHAVVEIGEDGEPTGVVAEIDELLPIPQLSGPEFLDAVVDAYEEQLGRHGVTAYGEIVQSVDMATTLGEAVESGRLPGRCIVYPIVPSLMSNEAALRMGEELERAFEPTAVRLGGLKLFADGGYSARNAATLTPYVDVDGASSHGDVNLTEETLTEALRAGAEGGVQCLIHTNGERAQLEVLRYLRDYQGEMPPLVRLEHAGNYVSDWTSPAQWLALGAMPVVQPGFLYSFIGDFFPRILGEPGATGRLPLRSMIDAGVRPVAASDFGLGGEEEQSSPMFSIWCCLERGTFLGDTVEPEEGISLEEALRMHTVDAASALGLEDEIGTLEVGKAADVVVIDRDIAAAAPRELRTAQVDAVVRSGKLVHARDGGFAEGR